MEDSRRQRENLIGNRYWEFGEVDRAGISQVNVHASHHNMMGPRCLSSFEFQPSDGRLAPTAGTIAWGGGGKFLDGNAESDL